MPLKTKENYLKTMYMIDEEKGIISLSELGKRLGLSIPTVNSMVKRLQDEGWVVYEKYQPVKLTGQGKNEAARVIRRHRIAEIFLVEKLNFGWEEVHDIAEEMEHIDSEVLFERMNKMLGNPAFDPHGSPIPDKAGKIKTIHYVPLASLESGQKAVLRSIHNSSADFLVFLNKKGISWGTIFEILEKEPFDGSVTVSYGGKKNVVLTQEVCKQLLVEL